MTSFIEKVNIKTSGSLFILIALILLCIHYFKQYKQCKESYINTKNIITNDFNLIAFILLLITILIIIIYGVVSYFSSCNNDHIEIILASNHPQPLTGF